MHLTLFICYVICSQGIMENYATKNNNERSDIHVRKRQIIDISPGGNQPVNIENIPYIVQIQARGQLNCAGSILIPSIVITCAHCVRKMALSELHVLSGSEIENNGTLHRVTRKIENPLPNRTHKLDDLAMLVILPPIDIIHSPNRPIELYDGRPIQIDESATVSGWGCNGISGNERKFPGSLRSITVSIFNPLQCRHIFPNPFNEITRKNICTYDPHKRKHCSYGDSGNPLVMHHKLVGIHTWNSKYDTEHYPDVYMFMGYPEYKSWIRSNIASHLNDQLN